MGSTRNDLIEQAPAITVFLVLGVGFTALFFGFEWFWIVFPLGFAVVLPLVAIVSRILVHDENERDDAPTRHGASDPDDERQDALDTLRDRYARGEIDEREFERRVDRLLENETIEDVESRGEREREYN